MAKKIKCEADPAGIRAIKDAMETLSGSWKLPILFALSNGTKRFKEISREVEGISDKMLSKELKDLETNHLVKRTVYDTFPPTVEYEITDYAETLFAVMKSLRDWGQNHRRKIIGN